MCPIYFLSLSGCFMEERFRNPLTRSLAANIGFCLNRGQEMPSQGVVPHLVLCSNCKECVIL